MGQRWLNEWILEHISSIPADFAGVYDITNNLAKEREPGIEIGGDIERSPLSLIIY